MAPTSSTISEKAHLPLDIFSHLCDILSTDPSRSSLASLSRAASDVYDTAIPHLYRKVSLDRDNIDPFLISVSAPIARSPGFTRSTQPATAHTTHLHIASLSDHEYPCTDASPMFDTTKLFPSLHILTLGSQTVWQMIVHAHTHASPHPLVDFLKTHTSPKHLIIHYPRGERTSHSFGGGFCCCMAAVRAFQRNPVRAAAYDTSSTAALISTLTEKWSLKSIRLVGVVDDQVPDVKTKKVEVEWASCQCADKDFHGEWCFNHVTPCKRVQQVRDMTARGKERGVEVELVGVESVAWTEKLGIDMKKWILEQVEREETECPSVVTR